MKAPLPENEASRLAWLRESRILDTPPEAAFDDVTQLAARICDTPIAAITFIDEERQWIKSILGLDTRQSSRDAAFCAHTILQTDVLIVPDARQDARFRDHAAVLGELQIRFYAGVPLLTSEGHALGSLCVVDTVPRTLSPEQIGVLEVLSHQIAGRIELQRQVSLQEQLIAERTRAENALRQSEDELRAIVEQAMDGIYLFDCKTYRLLKTNAALRDMLGYGAQEMEGFTLYDIVAHDQASIDRNVSAIVRDKSAALGERQYRRKGGSTVTVEVSARMIRQGAEEAMCVVVHNVNARKQAESARRLAEDSYRSLCENAVEGIFQTTPEGRFRQANPALARMYGYESPEEMMAAVTDVGDQIYADAGQRAAIVGLMQTQGRMIGHEMQIRRKDGSLAWVSASARPVFDADGELKWYEGIVEDISDRKDLEAQHEHELREAQERADRDPLTNLLNHRAFHRRLEEETDRAGRGGTTFAVVMMDLDNFKFFNEAYGHVLGDDVLRTVADRLRAVSRSYDILARFGGDEFAMILSDVGGTSNTQIETRLRASLAGLTYRPDDQKTAIPITVSVGVALASGCEVERADTVCRADERLRRAKAGSAMETETDQVRAAMRSASNGFTMLDSLVTAVDNKDRYTRRHSEDVAKYSHMIACELGLDAATRETISVAALLHDVGKIGVPDNILRKPGKLTPEEFEAVKHHPQMGALMVSTVPGLEATLDAVRHHHERWDGMGYPLGLKGEKTPLIARLMAVADAYSAMTTDRPYRQSLGCAQARARLEAGMETQWDPMIVQAFLRVLEKTPEASTPLSGA